MPSAFFPQALTFEAANAVVLAGLAKAAYGEFDEAKAAAAGYGLTAFEWIDLTQQFEDVYGFVAGGADYVVIAFRGTDPKNWKNWMTDLQATAARFDWLFQGAAEVGEVHAGFGHALFDAWAKIESALDKVMPRVSAGSDPAQVANRTQRTLWLTGH